MIKIDKKFIYCIDTKLIAYYLFQRGSSISGLFDKVAQFLYQYPKGTIYLAWDIGKSSHRTGISPTYKGHRAKAKEKLSQAEQDALVQFNIDYINLAELSDLLPVHSLKVQGVEADDMISIIAKQYENNPEYQVYLLTADMDYCHSVVGTSNVAIIDVYNQGLLIDHDVVVNKYNLDTRNKFSVLKSIQGDVSDNIKFCENLGPVKAIELFDRIYTKNKLPNINQIIQEIELYLEEKEDYRIKRKLKKSLSVHQDHVSVGRITAREAFIANMSIADPFIDTSNMSPGQIDMFNTCLDRVPPDTIKHSDILMQSCLDLGYPVNFGFKASKIFGVI